MQKEMALSFITKLQVIATLLMNYLIFFGFVKLVSFKKVIAFMQSVPIKKNSIIDPTTIYLYERKIARKLKISQCLISAGCLFKTFRAFGLPAELFIGIQKFDGFASHAWVVVNENKFLLNEKQNFKEILQIK